MPAVTARLRFTLGRYLYLEWFAFKIQDVAVLRPIVKVSVIADDANVAAVALQVGLTVSLVLRGLLGILLGCCLVCCDARCMCLLGLQFFCFLHILHIRRLSNGCNWHLLQHLARAVRCHLAYQTGALHVLNQQRGAVVANLQVTLHFADTGASTGAHDGICLLLEGIFLGLCVDLGNLRLNLFRRQGCLLEWVCGCCRTG